MAATVAGLTALGCDLERLNAAENTVVSPLSIAVAFAMVRAGARGETARQLDRVLRFPPAGLHAAMNSLTRELATTDAPQPPPTAEPGSTAPLPAPPVVSIADGLFAQRGLPLGQQFLRTLAAQYGSGVYSVDFSTPLAQRSIDAWVQRRTAGRISKLFDSLDPATRLVLANAIFLKASWLRPFPSGQTRDERFTKADGSDVRVPMMRLQAPLSYAAGDGWQAVELPYTGAALAMWVLVPTGSGRPADLLSPAVLRVVRSRLAPRPVTLTLPRWDFASDLDLGTELRRLGLTIPFGPAADFSGISPGLRISQAVHRATITVDEWGTEAAAVTGIAMQVAAPAGPELTVRADHPFAFAIVHRSTGTPLFLGGVGDPAAH